MPRTTFATTGSRPITPITTSTDIAEILLDHLNLPNTPGTINAAELRTRATHALNRIGYDSTPVTGGIIHTRLLNLQHLATHALMAGESITWAPAASTAQPTKAAA